MERWIKVFWTNLILFPLAVLIWHLFWANFNQIERVQYNFISKAFNAPFQVFVVYSPPNRVVHQTMEVITKLPMYGSSILWTPATSLQSGLLHSESTFFHEFGVFWCSVCLDCLSSVRTKSHTKNEITNSTSLRHKNSIESQGQWTQSQRNEYFQGTFLSTASPFFHESRIEPWVRNRVFSEREKGIHQEASNHTPQRAHPLHHLYPKKLSRACSKSLWKPISS